MNKYLFIASTNPFPGQDDAYNKWYEDEHMPDILQVPGFVAAQRFRVTGEPYQGPSPHYSYICIYEMETDDVAATLANLKTAAEKMFVSPAVDLLGAQVSVYSPCGPRHVQ